MENCCRFIFQNGILLSFICVSNNLKYSNIYGLTCKLRENYSQNLDGLNENILSVVKFFCFAHVSTMLHGLTVDLLLSFLMETMCIKLKLNTSHDNDNDTKIKCSKIKSTLL